MFVMSKTPTGWLARQNCTPPLIRDRETNYAVWPCVLFSISIWLGISCVSPYDRQCDPHPPRMQRTEFVLRVRVRHQTGMEAKRSLARVSSVGLEWISSEHELGIIPQLESILCFIPSLAATHTWLSGNHTKWVTRYRDCNFRESRAIELLYTKMMYVYFSVNRAERV